MSRGPEFSASTPSVAVHFSRVDRRYEPLERIDVRYVVETGGAVVRGMERSVLWYTEGKGEEDIWVHFFERMTDRATAAAATGTFGCVLPRSPLSYEGVIVKIRWCVRVRLFFVGGRDFISEHVFDLGAVPAARLPSPG